MNSVIVFFFAVGLAFYCQSNITFKVEKENNAQIKASKDHVPTHSDDSDTEQPSEKEDSKEKETEESDPKNYQHNRSLVNLNEVSGKILWALTNDNSATDPHIQKIHLPPEQIA